MKTGPRKIQGELTVTKDSQTDKIDSILLYQEKVEEASSLSTTKLLEVVFGGAISLGASDIHIEPEEEQVRLRVRIDGILHDVLDFSEQTYSRIASRIKLLGGLKLNISDRPQDGRFSILLQDPAGKKKNLAIEIRISALPSEQGEAIVTRILNPESLKDIEGLGLRNDLFIKVKKELKKPNGMIIVTGPTGSGKTTTLYAFCRKLNTPEVKIITIEDPIEYHLEGISQTQVNPKKGYTFASGLRSIVRQDPDTILVGEMRDKETVNIALQAGLTGHLVLTTLHTNDAAGVVVRLISLGGKIENISPALNMIIAQRLVRKVCPKCKVMEKPEAKELQKIKQVVSRLPKEVKVPEIKKIPKAKGCVKCNYTGYRGRIAIFEIFLIDDVKLKRAAERKGMTTMKQDGFLKVLKGETTIEEVERATG